MSSTRFKRYKRRILSRADVFHTFIHGRSRLSNGAEIGPEVHTSTCSLCGVVITCDAKNMRARQDKHLDLCPVRRVIVQRVHSMREITHVLQYCKENPCQHRT